MLCNLNIFNDLYKVLSKYLVDQAQTHTLAHKHTHTHTHTRLYITTQPLTKLCPKVSHYAMLRCRPLQVFKMAKLIACLLRDQLL